MNHFNNQPDSVDGSTVSPLEGCFLADKLSQTVLIKPLIVLIYLSIFASKFDNCIFYSFEWTVPA